MAFKLSRIFGNRGSEAADTDTANQRGSVQFEDVQVGRAIPEVGDEVVLNLNNKNPELTRYENMAQDGKFEPEVLSMDAATPKLAEAVASSDEGLGPDAPLAGKSTPFLFEAVAPPTEPNADGILPYLEQQPYHGGGEAMQDVFVTEAVAPAQDVFVTEVVSPAVESQVSVFGFGGGTDEAARTSGSLLDSGGPILGDDVEFTGSDEELGALIAWLRNRNLIDTSTGEIVWADEAIANATVDNADLRDRIAELRGNSLFDVSTGEILWNRQPAQGSNWYVPELDSDQSGMARGQEQVNVGGFGGGVDDSRVVQPEQPQSLYFEDSVRTAREATGVEGGAGVLSGHSGGWNVSGDWNGDGNDTVGASSLLDTDTVPTDSFSLNFEEIKQTVIESVDIDIDGPDADIELPD